MPPWQSFAVVQPIEVEFGKFIRQLPQSHHKHRVQGPHPDSGRSPNVDVNDADVLVRLVVARARWNGFDALYDVNATRHAAEDRVLAVQPRARHCRHEKGRTGREVWLLQEGNAARWIAARRLLTGGDEKLAAVGAWARVGHRHDARAVEPNVAVDLVLELVPPDGCASRAVAQRVTSLQACHEQVGAVGGDQQPHKRNERARSDRDDR